MYRYFYHTNNKKAVLAYSHYSDPEFNKPEGAIIFGKETKNTRWEYADRLQQWDSTKSKEAWEKATEECGNKRTAAQIEAYLRYYFDDPNLEIEVIVSGTQPFNGYPWYAYGFKSGK